MAGGKKPDTDDSDDPIAKSLQERREAGGITAVVGKGKGGQNGATPSRRPSTLVNKGPTKEETKEEEK